LAGNEKAEVDAGRRRGSSSSSGGEVRRRRIRIRGMMFLRWRGIGLSHSRLGGADAVVQSVALGKKGGAY
jgi:hypothetical protein